MQFTDGLILDIIIAAIVVLSVISGTRKGFVATVVSFLQWFVCLIIGFLACGKVREFLEDYTSMEDSIKNSVLNSLGSSIEDSPAYRSIPNLFSSWTEDGSNPLISGTADTITTILMSIIAFLTVVIGIKVISLLLLRVFSRRHRGGVTGFIDSALGLAFGAVRGVIYVFLFFTLLVPLLGLFMPQLSENVISAMDTSYVAKYLYNDNVLLIVIRDLFSA